MNKLKKLQVSLIYSNITKFNFCLHIPKKNLIFINHSTYGKVYPVYIAEESIEIKKKHIKSLAKLSFILASFNLYIFFSGVGVLPLSSITSIFLDKPILYLVSISYNLHILNKLLRSLSDNLIKIKNIYLKPNGKDIIIEKYYNNDIVRLEIGDIFNSNIFCKWQQKIRKESIYDTNNNSLRILISYGRNKELLLDGKRKFCDYEILQTIVNRYNIDTSQVGYNKMTEDIIPQKYVQMNKDNNKKRSIISYMKKSLCFPPLQKVFYMLNKKGNQVKQAEQFFK